MNANVRKKFRDLAEATLGQAEEIDCSPEDFAAGLGVVLDLLRGSQRAAEECVRATQKTVIYCADGGCPGHSPRDHRHCFP